MYIVGASQGFLLSFLLFFKRDRYLNWPLIVFMFLTSVELFFQFIYSSGLITQYPHFLYISEPFSMLSGVLLLLFTRNILNEKVEFRRFDLLAFIPFFAYVIYYMPSYLQSAEDKIFDITAFYSEGIFWSENLYEWIAEVIVSVPFLVLSVRLLNKYQEKIKNNYSEISKINYTTVRNLLIVCIGLYFVELVVIVLAFLEVQAAVYFNAVVYISLIIIFYFVGYYVLIRKVNGEVKYIYVNNTNQETGLEKTKPDAIIGTHNKYEKNSLSELKSAEISEKIIHCIEINYPYRNPELRLIDFSRLIDEHPNNVSQILNDVFKMNFYDFINSYRVEEAKKLLKLPDYANYTITAIGFEVGFNSKSAFYSAFKKFTNLTPAQFQKDK